MELFRPTFESLHTFRSPDWFQNAKFGIWSHWGPQSVPMYGDWYSRHMYIQGTPQYCYHIRHYGHPSKFGYKDICQLWKAESFDPEELMALYVRAGAHYFVAQATHHDHFFNYPSKLNRMNSVNVGPNKDIIGLWKAAADRYALPFGLSEHLGASFRWWRVNKGCDSCGPYKGVPYDGNDPAYQDFYHANQEHVEADMTAFFPWYTENKRFHAYWLECMKEVIDLYSPYLLYSDGGLPFGQDGAQLDDHAYSVGLEAAAYLYNHSIMKHGENLAIYTQKDRRQEIYSIGLLDIEKSQLNEIQQAPWQTDTCIGRWFYDVKVPYKRPDHIIDMLIDIVSKNGTMLLNILQKPDGTIDDEARYILEELSGWMPICGEGIFGTRPWKTFSEGDTRVIIHGFTEEKTLWNASDVRFTCKGNSVYAFLMGGVNHGVVVLRSFCDGERVSGVRLLGGGEIPFQHQYGVLTIPMPHELPSSYVNALAITLDKV